MYVGPCVLCMYVHIVQHEYSVCTSVHVQRVLYSACKYVHTHMNHVFYNRTMTYVLYILISIVRMSLHISPSSQVDAHNIVPVWVASDKLEYAARTIRPKIHKHLAEFLVDIPPVKTHPHKCNMEVCVCVCVCVCVSVCVCVCVCVCVYMC